MGDIHRGNMGDTCVGESTGVKKGVSESQLSSGSSAGKVRTTVEKVSMKGVKVYI